MEEKNGRSQLMEEVVYIGETRLMEEVYIDWFTSEKPDLWKR